jgi:hypothetical protein
MLGMRVPLVHQSLPTWKVSPDKEVDRGALEEGLGYTNSTGSAKMLDQLSLVDWYSKTYSYLPFIPTYLPPTYLSTYLSSIEGRQHVIFGK